MRKTWFALLILACATAGQSRAQPTTPPRVDPARNRLDNYLVRWEEAMKKVESLALACTRTEVDAIYKTRKSYEGTIHFLKPTYFFWNMKVKDRPQDFERFICTGTYIYQFIPSEKVIKYYAAPKAKPGGGLADDSSIAFLFGMKAAEAKQRYDLSLFKEDTHYVFVDIVARRDVDKADFQKARIVLNKDTFLPRQLWFKHPNGNEMIWDIPTIQSGVALKREVFGTPQTPPGWKLVPGQAPAKQSPGSTPPRVYRPQR